MSFNDVSLPTDEVVEEAKGKTEVKFKNSVPVINDKMELSKEELLRDLERYRDMNIALLEEKRQLLLQAQDNFKLEGQLRDAKMKLEELNTKIQLYESKINTTNDQCSSSYDDSERSDSYNPKEKEDPEQENINRHKIARKCCDTSSKLDEVVRVNHIWQKDYLKLQAENVKSRARVTMLEKQVKDLINLNRALEVGHLSNNSENSPECENLTADDIEAIRQQLAIFKDDYEQEQKDNKKLEKSVKELHQELYRANNRIDELAVKNNNIKEKYRRASYQREHLLHELRRLSTTSLPLSPVATNNEGFDTSSLQGTEQHSPGASTRQPSKPPEFYYVERDGVNSRDEHLTQFEIVDRKTPELISC